MLNCLITEVRFDDRKTIGMEIVIWDTEGISNITHAPVL